jgi:ATP-dependent helicase/nuclease subunit A
MHLKVISAGAGSGKTYALTQEMIRLLQPGPDGAPAPVRASGLLATTFTNLAAAELEERVRIGLLEKGLTREADELSQAMIGTVHSIGAKLLKRFAFEAGVSPEVEIMADEDHQRFFNLSLASVLTPETIEAMDRLSDRLGLLKPKPPVDWRRTVREITEVARSNNFDAQTLRRSLAYSLSSFFELLPEPERHGAEYYRERLETLLKTTIEGLQENTSDTTVKTLGVLDTLKTIHRKWKNEGVLPWYQWAKMSTLDVGKSSRAIVADLVEFADRHDRQPAFRADLSDFVGHLFELSIAALNAYDQFKKERGLIDYSDMEVLLLRLLDHPRVRAVLHEELDLLLVDEFQDTNPIQLQIFLQLTRSTKMAIWVGDPKQSIYGFRGAAPELMQAVVESAQERDTLRYSWRSREELVHTANGIFTQAFGDMPVETVALEPAPANRAQNEPAGLETALWYWHFKPEPDGPKANGQWFDMALARQIAETLRSGLLVRDGNDRPARPIRPSDVAVLCRTNTECREMAAALAAHGIEASVSRAGLLGTPEASLALACLRFILNLGDSLAIAEILRLAQGESLEDIVDHRIDFLEKKEREALPSWTVWAQENPFVAQLEKLRLEVQELSPSELLTLTLEQLDLRRIVAAWGNAAQRHANLDELRRLSAQYEDACHRRHDAATWGGFLLWLDNLAIEGQDHYGEEVGENTVQVLTFHKSKGLEWSFVVCHGLDSKLKESVFGLSIVREKPTIDLENPLADRLLRYWPYPYADQSKNIRLLETLADHEAQRAGLARALQEEARVLYVALTRARDYLVVPGLHKGHTLMLNRVWHGGEEKTPTFDPECPVAPWLWNGQEIPVRGQTIVLPRDYAPPLQVPSNTPLPYLRERSGSRKHVPLLLEAPDERATKIRLRTDRVVLYGGRAPETDWPMLDAFLAADNPAYPLERRLQLAGQLLRLHQQQDWDAEGLVAYSDAFYESFHERYGQPIRLHRKLPVRRPLNGQLLETTVDLVLEIHNGSVLVFHHPEAVDQVRWKTKALDEAARIALSMEQLSGLRPVAAWVHFWQGGGLVELTEL